MGVILVADTHDEGNIPRVHAKQVVKLVDSELLCFGGFPVRGSHDGERNALLFDVGCHVGIGQHFENVTCAVSVVNPFLVREHGIPGLVICHLTRFPDIGNIGEYECFRAFAVVAHVAKVCNHVRDTVFDGVQPFRFGKAVYVYRLVLVLQD